MNKKNVLTLQATFNRSDSRYDRVIGFFSRVPTGKRATVVKEMLRAYLEEMDRGKVPCIDHLGNVHNHSGLVEPVPANTEAITVTQPVEEKQVDAETLLEKVLDAIDTDF